MIGLAIKIPIFYRLILDKKFSRVTLRRVGSEIASVARRKVRRAVGSGRIYYGSGKRAGTHRASAPGESPVGWSGDLANSIKSRLLKDGDGILIKDTMFYALFLEAGAKGGIGSGKKGVKGKRNVRSRRGGIRTIKPTGNRVLEPRPFLSAALDERSASIGQRVKDAIIKGMEFRKVSATTKV